MLFMLVLSSLIFQLKGQFIPSNFLVDLGYQLGTNNAKVASLDHGTNNTKVASLTCIWAIDLRVRIQ